MTRTHSISLLYFVPMVLYKSLRFERAVIKHTMADFPSVGGFWGFRCCDFGVSGVQAGWIRDGELLKETGG